MDTESNIDDGEERARRESQLKIQKLLERFGKRKDNKNGVQENVDNKKGSKMIIVNGKQQ